MLLLMLGQVRGDFFEITRFGQNLDVGFHHAELSRGSARDRRGGGPQRESLFTWANPLRSAADMRPPIPNKKRPAGKRAFTVLSLL